MEKLNKKKYFHGFSFFLSTVIFIIFSKVLTYDFLMLIRGEESFSILKFSAYSFICINLYVIIEFFRIKTKLSAIKIRLFILLIIIISILNFSLVPKNYHVILEVIIIDFGSLYLIFEICKKYSGNYLLWLGLKSFRLNDFKYFGYYFLAWPVIIFWGLIIEFFNLELFKSDYSKEIIEALNYNYLLIFLLSCLVAPICEEIVFRGFIYKLIKIRFNIFYAVMLNSVFFGFIHIEPSAVIPATILGVSLSIVRIKTNSLLPSIIIHSLHNLFALIINISSIIIESKSLI